MDANRGEGHNFTEECRDATLGLQACMESHRDYYKDFMLEPDFDDKNGAAEVPGAHEPAAEPEQAATAPDARTEGSSPEGDQWTLWF